MVNLTQSNVKRLASISAFGAGVLAVSAPNAEASILVFAPNVTVGFASGNSSTYTVNVPGIHDFFLERTSSTSSHTYRVRLRGGSSNFATVGADRLRAFAAGAKWSVVGAAISSFGFVATRSGGANHTNISPTNKYFLFTFSDSTSGGALRYGWGELSVSFPGNMPSVVFSRYAYNDAGAQILTGDVGTVTPEPSGFALTGLGALAIGARGLRRWRVAKKAA